MLGALVAITLAVAGCPVALRAGDASDRPAPPAAAKVAALLSELPGLFGAEWTAAQGGGRAAVALAAMLRATAADSKDLVEQYVLRREAAAWSLTGAELAPAMEDVDRLLALVSVRPDALLGEVFDRAARSRALRPAELELLVVAFAGTEHPGKDPAVLRAWHEAMSSYGRRISAVRAVAALTELRRRMDAQAKAAEELAKAMAVLEKTPADPAANLVLAKHLLGKGDPLERAAPYLALVAESRLALAATAQLAYTGAAGEAASLFERWAVAADVPDPLLAHAAAEQAIRLGEVVMAEATGLARTRVERRMAPLRTRLEALTAQVAVGQSGVGIQVAIQRPLRLYWSTTRGGRGSSKRMILGRNGQIPEGANQYESAYRIEGNKLIFLNRTGKIHAVFVYESEKGFTQEGADANGMHLILEFETTEQHK